MKNTKLVCFDLDDTLIREVHSVMLPCIINGKEYEHSIIQKNEEDGELDYITADYQRAKLTRGLTLSFLKSEFTKHIKPLKNIEAVISRLKKENIKCILITVGPIQVARLVGELWGFDYCYGSDYEIVDGSFTGNIISYITAEGKIDCLTSYCSEQGTDTSDCIAVGDGSTDIPVFNICGGSIALNGNEKAKQSASISIDTDDLNDILDYIIGDLYDKSKESF